MLDNTCVCAAALQVLDPGEDLWAAIMSGRAGEVTDSE
jgi:hypothetical protein